MFRAQQIIIREYVCTSLKLLNYLKNTEFKILQINPDVVAAIHLAGVRGDPCGAVRWTAVQRTAPHGSPRIPATRFAATTPEKIF